MPENTIKAAQPKPNKFNTKSNNFFLYPPKNVKILMIKEFP